MPCVSEPIVPRLCFQNALVTLGTLSSGGIADSSNPSLQRAPTLSLCATLVALTLSSNASLLSPARKRMRSTKCVACSTTGPQERDLFHQSSFLAYSYAMKYLALTQVGVRPFCLRMLRIFRIALLYRSIKPTLTAPGAFEKRLATSSQSPLSNGFTAATGFSTRYDRACGKCSSISRSALAPGCIVPRK